MVANARWLDGARRPGVSVVRSRDPLPPGDRLLAARLHAVVAGRTPDAAACSRLLMSRMCVRVLRSPDRFVRQEVYYLCRDL